MMRRLSFLFACALGADAAQADAAPAGLAADIENAIRTLTLAEQARRLSGPSLTPTPDKGEVITFWD